MRYDLLITKRAEELLDSILSYIMKQLQNPQAAANLLDNIEYIYHNLQQNPRMYVCLDDEPLKEKKYRKVTIPYYNYLIIYRVDEETHRVYVLGFFHELESYINKL